MCLTPSHTRTVPLLPAVQYIAPATTPQAQAAAVSTFNAKWQAVTSAAAPIGSPATVAAATASEPAPGPVTSTAEERQLKIWYGSAVCRGLQRRLRALC